MQLQQKQPPHACVPPSFASLLPVEVWDAICEYAVFADLHALEQTSTYFSHLIRQRGVWKRFTMTKVVAPLNDDTPVDWKHIAWLATRRRGREKASSMRARAQHLLRGIRRFSSADRPSESPVNTLTPSPCWSDLQLYQGPLQDALTLTDVRDDVIAPRDITTFQMSLGERIQLRCGCSTGHSCYWSSSASSSPDTNEFIEYDVDGPAVLSAMEMLPYRVFWHPESPTYAPKQVYFEFLTMTDEETNQPTIETVFYTSPVYDIVNEMTLQTFAFPKRVFFHAAHTHNVIRMHLIGRQQAQTFQVPQWLQRTPDDALPKYYCCLSYVNAVGVRAIHGSRKTSKSFGDRLRSLIAIDGGDSEWSETDDDDTVTTSFSSSASLTPPSSPSSSSTATSARYRSPLAAFAEYIASYYDQWMEERHL